MKSYDWIIINEIYATINNNNCRGQLAQLGDHPPTNSEIQVQLSRWRFCAPWQFVRITLTNQNYWQSGSYTLSTNEKESSLNKLVHWCKHLAEVVQWHHMNLLHNSSTNTSRLMTSYKHRPHNAKMVAGNDEEQCQERRDTQCVCEVPTIEG